MPVIRGQELHVVSLYRRYLGINSFFWTSGIYDICATWQLHIKNNVVERSRSSSFVQLMFTNVYLNGKKIKIFLSVRR